MRVAITGAGGQLGKELQLLFGASGHEVIAWSRADLDVTDAGAVAERIAAAKPDVILHCAAYTKVDDCETQVERAFLVNATGAGNVARAANQIGAKLVYISTDYVFDGAKGAPYVETDTPNPINVYGASKLEGERLVARLHDRHFIVRTSWLYGEHGPNFVATMLRLARDNKEIRVVDDQVGSPTWTRDLAKALLNLVTTDGYGIYHLSNSGCCTWFEFAREIFFQAGLEVSLTPITSEEYRRPARRPQYSVLEHARWIALGNADLPDWRESLSYFIRRSDRT